MDEEKIYQAVGRKYGEVAKNPDGKHGFPVGLDFAKSVGYPEELLNRLPKGAVESFAGLSTPVLFAELQEGETVIDLGCGAGMDSLIAAEFVSETGKVFAVEMSEPMLLKAKRNAEQFGATNIEFLKNYASKTGLDSDLADVVFCNGIFNLSPDKAAVFKEIHRVLKHQGRLVLSEIVRTDDTKPSVKPSLDDWFK